MFVRRNLVLAWLVSSLAGSPNDAFAMNADEVGLDATPVSDGVWQIDLDALVRSDSLRSVVHGVPLRGHEADACSLELVRRSPVSERVRIERQGGRTGAEISRGSTRSWGGTVAGDPGSNVFISSGPSGTFGWIEQAGKRWSISSGPIAGGGGTHLLDLESESAGMIDWSTHACETESLMGPPPRSDRAQAAIGRGSSQCLNLLIAIETDTELLERFGGDPNAAFGYIETLVAAADFVFDRDFGGGLELGFVRFWESQDPWLGQSTSERLSEFRNYWLQNETEIPRDTAHFLSGASLGGGRAFVIGAVDPMQASYAISGNINGYFPFPVVSFDPQNWDIFVFLHELGHLLGSPHTHAYNPQIDGCGTGDCSLAVGGTIMSYCHQCSGGYSNIDIAFHPIVQDRIVEFRTFDLDGDGYGDSCDLCREDPNKQDPGICGCSRPDVDEDGDGQFDCLVDDFNVPDDFSSLQAAVDAAPPDAIITVAAGVWPVAGSIDPLGKRITIQGTRDSTGRIATTLVSTTGGRIFSCTQGREEITIFADLRLEGTDSEIGGGVATFNSSPVFRDCEFISNSAPKGGALIVLGDVGGPRFERCLFLGNEAVRDGGAVYVRMSSIATFIDCIFSMNRAGDSGSVALNLSSEPIRFENTVVCGSGEDPIQGHVQIGGGCIAGGCLDTNGDGIVDGCGGSAPCEADLDFDGKVGSSDLGLLLTSWGRIAGFNPADFNQDGWIDAKDLASVLLFWGPCPE